MATEREQEAVAQFCLSDPAGTIERECADRFFKQKDVAITYALAIMGEDVVPVDWARVNAAIRNRWPRGLDRVKKLAWKRVGEKATPTPEPTR